MNRSMQKVEELKSFLREMKHGEIEHYRFKTYMNEILILSLIGLREFIVTKDMHYTANSMIHSFTFADGKTYEIEIKEVRA